MIRLVVIGLLLCYSWYLYQGWEEATWRYQEMVQAVALAVPNTDYAASQREDVTKQLKLRSQGKDQEWRLQAKDAKIELTPQGFDKWAVQEVWRKVVGTCYDKEQKREAKMEAKGALFYLTDKLLSLFDVTMEEEKQKGELLAKGVAEQVDVHLQLPSRVRVKKVRADVAKNFF